jgi:hypothetical protein
MPASTSTSPLNDVERLGARAREAAIAAAWHQWAVLGSTGTSSPNASVRATTTMIDPEALVAASLVLLPHERRLGDVLAWWAAVGTSLLSVQRSRAVFRQIAAPLGSGDEASEAFGAFAAAAQKAGDKRWKRWAGEAPLEGRPGKGAAGPRLQHPATLPLRLRAGFGVSSKTDLLAVLLGMEGRAATIRSLVQVTTYSAPAVRTAADEMLLARVVKASGEYPADYAIERPAAWTRLLLGENADAPSRLPTWGHWLHVYGFLLAVTDWSDRAAAQGWDAYLAGSRARDVSEAFDAPLRAAGFTLPAPADHPGEAFLLAFARAVETVAEG